MLDKQDRDAQSAQAADESHHLDLLARVEPRRGLVEEEERGLRGNGPRHLDQLLLAEGQAARAVEPDSIQPHRGEGALRTLEMGAALPSERRHGEGGAEEAGRRIALAADHDVLDDGETREELYVLKGP